MDFLYGKLLEIYGIMYEKFKNYKLNIKKYHKSDELRNNVLI